jgi:hypothetical protein
LKKLRVAGWKRAILLRSVVEHYSPPLRADQLRAVAYVAIETQNLWASFARAYYLSCALKAKTEAGLKVTITQAGITAGTDAIAFALKLLKPWITATHVMRREEPTWQDTHNILRLFTAIGASNSIQVQTALSYPTRVFELLPSMRNFFAHRNDETARKAATVATSLGISSRIRPEDMLSFVLPGRPQNVLADWLDDIRAVIALLCQ